MADSNACGLERVGNVLLVPFQYVFNGKVITRDPNHPERFSMEPHFDYEGRFSLKIAASIIASPVSLAVGSLVKGIAYLSYDVREKHDAFLAWRSSPTIDSNLDKYRSWGMAIDDTLEPVQRALHERRPGDTEKMQGEKEALRDIVKVLKEDKIVFWIDCGSCLGAYRYGGAIPWDCDIDIAILQDDVDNIKHALNKLDQSRYAVQDWSGRDKPKSYLKVYDRKSNSLIDMYVFKVDPVAKNVTLILANENSIFLSNAWKIREKRYILPTPFEIVFPLRKIDFDGVEVYVPNQTKKYLQMRYGENLDPVKIYDPKTGQYEKDLSHPYWQMPYVK